MAEFATQSAVTDPLRQFAGNRPAARPLTMLLTAALVLCGGSVASAQRLDQLALDRYPDIREAERFQLKVAEQYYERSEWKAAAAEYEKFLTLYEDSAVASYTQLKWSLCQVQLRKLNTAITEGFQSVIDYWPESPDAMTAAYYIGRTYQDMGEIGKAKKAYSTVFEDYGDAEIAAYAARDMIEIARSEEDVETQLEMWERLTFETPRDNRYVAGICVDASRQLASHFFSEGNFEDGAKALETTYGPTELIPQVVQYASGPIRTLAADSKTASQAERLADRAVAWVQERIEQDLADPELEDAARAAWYAVADLQAAAGREPQVKAAYEQIISRFGPSDETLLRQGNWYKSIGQYETARSVYGRFEDDVEGKHQIANSFREEKNYEQAVAAYRQLSLQDEEEPFRWIGEAAATWRHWAHNYPEAVTIYTELVQQDVEHIDTWLWALADTYHHAGQYKEAIQHYRQCNEYYPETHFRMASCHRALKEYGEALLLYGGIIGSAPAAAPRAQLESARTYEEQEQKEKAILAFQKVCKEYPKSGEASTAHAHLQTEYKITVTLGGSKDE